MTRREAIAMMAGLPFLPAALRNWLRKPEPQEVKSACDWKPYRPFQECAVHSEANEVLFGGTAGCGKTDLLLGLAGTEAKHSIIFRSEYCLMRAMIERSREIYRGKYIESLRLWKLSDGRTVQFAIADPEVWRGRRYYDLVAFDELQQIDLATYIRLIANCLKDGGRLVSTASPSKSAKGRWVVKRWAEWLDPACSYQLRPAQITWCHGSPNKWYSRTFIPARLADNPGLASSGYEEKIKNLPEPLRSQLLYGDFTIGPDPFA